MPPPDGVTTLVDRIGPVEVVVGIPSFNNAKTIPHVAATAVRGLAAHFPGRPGLVLNSDGGSPDDTPLAMVAAAESERSRVDGGDSIEVATLRYRGVSGKGSAFRELFEAASRLGAKALVLLDADLRSVTPEWIGRLASPIVDDVVDYMTPLYVRHKFDGTITNSIVYPMTDALFGGGVRQPIGGDFGVSGLLAGLYASKEVWDSDVARFGIDLWMTTTALAEELRVGQACLGAKVHDPKDPGQHLANMLVEVVGTAFSLLEHYESKWTSGVRRPPAGRFGEPPRVALDPVSVNVDRMIEQFSFGMTQLEEIYRILIPEELFMRLQESSGDIRTVPIDEETWAQTLFRFALAWHRHAMPRDQIVRSLTPLYLGRTASFVLRNLDSSESESEAAIERLAESYRREAPELIRLWKQANGG